MKYIPHPYQEHSTQHIWDNRYCGLFLEMGLGKTVATLTAIDRLIKAGEVKAVLVIAPKRVAEDTWTTEASKWDHLRHLRISKILGKEKQRKTALRVKADIHVINRENVVWLAAQFGSRLPWDMYVIDELSSFKAADAIRFRTLRRLRPGFKRVVGLTGTPAPNNLLDLWPQMYLLDRGERLGKTLGEYRNKYFTRSPRSRENYELFDPKKVDHADVMGEDIYEKEIYNKIGDICISMKAADYLQLPERIDRTVDIHFPSAVRLKYEEFEREQVLAIADLEEITAINAAALTTKLLQYANGAVYRSLLVNSDGAPRKRSDDYYEVHDEKLEALEEIVEAAQGKPVLVFYSFKHDLDRIKRRLKRFKPMELKDSGTIKDWNNGEIKVLLAHPASAGHGLNLQAGGNIIVWFGLPWSLELYQQANARLHRQGQLNAVIIHHLVATGTIDEDVVEALGRKARGQDALLNAVKARVVRIWQEAGKMTA